MHFEGDEKAADIEEKPVALSKIVEEGEEEEQQDIESQKGQNMVIEEQNNDDYSIKGSKITISSFN